MKDGELKRLMREVASLAAEIEAMFQDKVFVTIIVRNELPDRNCVVTSDSLLESIVTAEFLETLKVEKPIV